MKKSNYPKNVPINFALRERILLNLPNLLEILVNCVGRNGLGT